MEYTAIRNAASVYDLTPMVKYRHQRAGRRALSQPADRARCRQAQPGSVHYTVWCDDDGKVLDDGTLFRLGPADSACAVRSATCRGFSTAPRVRRHGARGMTEEIAALSLQGPCSFAVLGALGLGSVADLKPFRMGHPKPKAGKIMVSRTGFTGDLGYELWTTPEQALALWDQLFDRGRPQGIRAIGVDGAQHGAHRGRVHHHQHGFHRRRTGAAAGPRGGRRSNWGSAG